MLIYILLVLFLIVTAVIFLLNHKTKSKFLFVACAFISLFLISALRSPQIGADTKGYITLFNTLKTFDIPDILNTELYFEKGYLIFNYFIHYFSSDSRLLLLISSFIIIFSIARLIYKNSVSVFLSFYLFITMAYFYSSMNILRQYIAVAILTWSYDLVKQRKPLLFLASVVLASSFHNTAIVFLIVYFFPLIKFSFKKVFMVISLALIFSLFIGPAMEIITKSVPQYADYLSYLDSNKVASFFNALVLIVVLLLGLIIKYRERNESKNVFLKTYLLNNQVEQKGTSKEKDITKQEDETLLFYIILAATTISIMSFKMSILARVAEYFAFYSILYIPLLIQKIKNPHIKNMIFLSVVLFAFLYNGTIFLFRPEWYQVTPYKFFK